MGLKINLVIYTNFRSIQLSLLLNEVQLKKTIGNEE